MAATPQVDSRDFYPLELLLKAQYVILTTPLQRHLSNPEEQRVVEVVFKAFTEKWEIAQDFEELPEQFGLAGGADLSVYRRIQFTSHETAVRTFAAMKSFIGRRPGRQPDWIVLSASPEVIVTSQEDGVLQVVFPQQPGGHTSNPHDRKETSLAFLYIEETNGRGKIQGALKCSDQADQIRFNIPQAELGVHMIDSEGKITMKNREERILSTSEEPFSHDIYVQEPAYLLFEINHTNQIESCKLWVELSFARGF